MILTLLLNHQNDPDKRYQEYNQTISLHIAPWRQYTFYIDKSIKSQKNKVPDKKSGPQ